MDLVGTDNIYPTTLTAIGYYLSEEDIPGENVKKFTKALVNRVPSFIRRWQNILKNRKREIW